MATQPPLAEVSDLAAWVGQDIPDSDPRAGAVLSAASTLVRAEADPDVAAEWAMTTAPDEVSMVVVQVAARVWLNPTGMVAESVDDYTARWAESESGVYLTKTERDVLSKYRTKAKGVWTLGTTRGDYTGADQFLDVTGSEPMPFLPDGA